MAEFSIKNLFKEFLREKLGFKFHYYPPSGMDVRTLPVYEKLSGLINFKVLGEMNRFEWEMEARWEDGKGTGKEGKSVADYRRKIVEIYTGFKEPEKGGSIVDTGKDIRDSIGPFTERDILYAEGGGADVGTGFIGVPIQINVENTTVSEITPGTPLTYSIPKERTIKYRDGRSYNVAFFGRKQPNPYWAQLDKDIDNICQAVQNTAVNLETDQQKKELITKNVHFIKGKTKGLIGRFNDYTTKFEEEHRLNLVGGGGVQKHYSNLETLRKEIWDLKLKDHEVYYTHTYKVIKPLDEHGRLLDIGGHVIAQLPAGFQQGKEKDPGIDENYWPLEVGDDKTLFEGRVIPLGTIVIDFYEGRSPNGGPPRQVDPIFIEDCDLLETITWIETNYDALRDDLRDARYFKNAITVMERIMTELQDEGYGIPDIKHPQTMGDIESGRHAEITMNLNRPGTPRSVRMKMGTSHLEPAFDLRAKEAAKHIGRKYYYNLQDDIQREKSTKPTITTRGAAMYILHRVIEETKYWDNSDDPKKPPGVVQVMQAIGAQTNGFDIGPNMRLDSPQPGWGRPFSRHPFRLR